MDTFPFRGPHVRSESGSLASALPPIDDDLRDLAFDYRGKVDAIGKLGLERILSDVLRWLAEEDDALGRLKARMRTAAEVQAVGPRLACVTAQVGAVLRMRDALREAVRRFDDDAARHALL